MSRLFLIMMMVISAVAVASQERQQYSNLPTLYVDIAGGQFVEDKETYLDCVLEFVGAGVDTVFSDGRIRGRGNSTWVRGPKLPYRLKFYSKHRLMGPNHANAKSWVLLANNFDKTLMRNAVASFIARELGQKFVPGAQFVDLVVNGRFDGNYQLTDHIEVRTKRIEIHEQEDFPAEGDDISGGYYVEVCNDEEGADVFTTNYGTVMRLRSPDVEVTAESQREYIVGYMNELERRLFTSKFRDAEVGYRAMVDSVSLASWFLTSEFAANPDAYWSTNIYKERGDNRLFFGPIWDYDIAFNNSNRLGDASEKLMLDCGHGQGLGTMPWVRRMMKDPWFLALIKREWEDAIANGIEERTLAYVDSLATLLDESQRLNYEVYNIGEAYWDEYQLFSTYAEGVEFLKSALRNRARFMTYTFCDESAELKTYVVPTESGIYRIYNLGVEMPVCQSDDEAVALGSVSEESGEGYLWQLKREGEYFRIVNVKNGLAITDTKTHGRDLELQPESDAVAEQLWDIQGLSNDENSCVVVGAVSDLAWNNNGGKAEVGNRLMSWTNDEMNASKGTRQWLFELVGETEAIEDVREPNYAVTYSKSAQALRFVAYGYGDVEGELAIYSLSGIKVFESVIAPEVSLRNLAPGSYVMRWRTGTQMRSLKFIK